MAGLRQTEMQYAGDYTMNQTAITTWATLDEANQEDGHYQNYPEFYRAALEAEHRALIDRNAAIDAWIDCPDWQAGRMRECRRSVAAAEERWIDCRSAVNVLYHHWQRLQETAARECECENPDVLCQPCRARGRLNDSRYEPNLNELLHEE
jgi:hypothetical protein